MRQKSPWPTASARGHQPEQLARIIEREIAIWAKVVKAANIKVDD